MSLLFSNNASGTLANTLQIVDTSLVLNSGEGALFPAPTGGDTFYASVEDTSGNLEIISCTARSGDTLTVTRAQESTSALLFAAGSRVEIRVTAATLAALIQTVDASALFAPSTVYSVDGTNAEILDDGDLSIKSSQQGLKAIRASGQTDTVMSLRNTSEVEEGYISTNNAKLMIVRNTAVSGVTNIDTTNASGTPVTGIEIDPDDRTVVRHGDIDKIQTEDFGASTHAAASLAPYNGHYAILTADGVTTIARLGFIDTVNEFRIASFADGFTVALMGNNSSGTLTRVVDGSPDGSQSGYFSGAKKYSTADDGLAVTGLVSGTAAPTSPGHLTRKDYVDAAVASATSPDSTLSANGFYTHQGAGGFTDQWGTASNVPSNNYVTVTFPTSFTSAFSVVATAITTDISITQNIVSVSNIGATTFRLYNGHESAMDITWQAKGVV